MMANPIQFTQPIPATGHPGLRRVTDPALIHAANHPAPSSKPAPGEASIECAQVGVKLAPH
jgi:hypothetical protein